MADSNRTRRRPDRAQLSVVLDSGLVLAVRACAGRRGVSVASLVESALEVMLDDGAESGSRGRGGAAEEGGGVGRVGGRDRVTDPVSHHAGGVDWAGVLAAGRAAKTRTVSDSQSDSPDPLEEIA